MKNYNNLQGGSVARMRAMRAYIERWNRDHVMSHGRRATLDSFKQARSHGVGTIGTDAHGLNFCNGHAVIPSSVVSAWRNLGDAHGIVNVGHTGWYADAYQDELYVGHVWQLPACNGEPQYVAGYIERDSGYTVLDCTGNRLDIYNDKEDAARAADSLAERMAEKEREHSERYKAARELEMKRDNCLSEMRGIRSEVKNTVAVIRKLDGKGRAYMVTQLDNLRAEFSRHLGLAVEHNETLRTEYGDIA